MNLKLMGLMKMKKTKMKMICILLIVISTTNRIVNSFKGIGEDRSKPIVKYESSVSGGSDYDEDDYIDLINFDVPLFDDKMAS